MSIKASRSLTIAAITILAITFVGVLHPGRKAIAQTTTPSLVDPNLSVRTAVSGLTTPTSIAFLGVANDFFVVEKNTGMVKRVTNGVPAVVLDLAVNNSSERGLLGIALHPSFPSNSGVYLYWSCAAPPPTGDTFTPTQRECSDPPATGADTEDLLAAPLLGNRVDRFIWNGTTLTYDKNITKLHSLQNDAGPTPPNQADSEQPPRGNHNAGVIRFGPDGKLYIIIGDNGRRGQLQNLVEGPTPPSDDDQFGGPEPDAAHLTGVILRLNDDGTIPGDNPFVSAGAAMSGEVGASLQQIFAYGVRNSFGMAFDPATGFLWTAENGDDSFDEINLVERGMNGGWIQFIGPASRINEFKQIEVTFPPGTLQQLRWSPTNIADTEEEARARLFMIPGTRYKDPEFSWKWAVAPAGIGFISGPGLGGEYQGDLIVGSAIPILQNGFLFRFKLSPDRQQFLFQDPKLDDKVADNLAKYDITESESLLFGSNFGISTDVETGPNGNLYVVSLANGAVYEIFRLR